MFRSSRNRVLMVNIKLLVLCLLQVRCYMHFIIGLFVVAFVYIEITFSQVESESDEFLFVSQGKDKSLLIWIGRNRLKKTRPFSNTASDDLMSCSRGRVS